MSFSPAAAVPRPANAPLPSPPIIYRTVPPRHAQPARPLATLPPTLTDAQLAQLDVLTREAIDERLRVLEGVSTAMYRCVQELIRLRSVLPVSAGPAPPAVTQVVQSQPGQGPTVQASVNGSVNAPDLRPLDSDSKLDAQSSNATQDTDVSGASGSAGRSAEAEDEADAAAHIN
jgi:E3 ubiquitin-protein ligase synoviolin